MQQNKRTKFIAKAIQTGRPVLVNDLVTQDKSYSAANLDTKSILVIPIFVGSQIEAIIKKLD